MRGFRTKKYMVIEDCRGYVIGRAPNPRSGLSHKGMDGLYRVVANWLIRNNIDTIAGPVCSGSVMAYAIAAASGGKITPSFVEKANGRYKPAVYMGDLEISDRYVVVDDVVSTGTEILYTMERCREHIGEKPKAILCFQTYAPRALKESEFSEVPLFLMGFRRG